jgi:hypothetical protein
VAPRRVVLYSSSLIARRIMFYAKLTQLDKASPGKGGGNSVLNEEN